jgi:phosphate uptake regulator
MQRKLVKQGESTLMVSLPSTWIKQKGLSKGDVVFIDKIDDKLSISSNKSTTVKEISVDVSDLSPLVNRRLLTLYLTGYDIVRVSFRNAKEIQKFKNEVINELLGWEIVSQSANNFVIRDITGTADTDVYQILNRLFFVLDSMFDELGKYFQGESSVELVVKHDETVNRLSYYCLRLLQKNYSGSKVAPLYTISSILEELGDHCKSLAQLIGNTSTNEHYVSHLGQVQSLLQSFRSLMMHFSWDKAIEIAKTYEVVKKSLRTDSLCSNYLFLLSETIIRINNQILSLQSLDEDL